MVVADGIYQTKEKGDTIYLRKLHLIRYYICLLEAVNWITTQEDVDEFSKVIDNLGYKT